MTNREQKLLNARLRIAMRSGELPFTFEDEQEKNYRKIVYETGREMGCRFTATKTGSKWVINRA